MVASRQRQQAAQRPIYSNLSYSRVIHTQPGDAMTAPRRRNGAPVAFIERSCEGKRRFPDELTARAVGMADAELRGDKPDVYRCQFCIGRHMTKKYNTGDRDAGDILARHDTNPSRDS